MVYVGLTGLFIVRALGLHPHQSLLVGPGVTDNSVVEIYEQLHV